MSLSRLNVAARFVLVLLIGLFFQAAVSVVAVTDLKRTMLNDRTAEVKHLLEAGYSTLVLYHQQSLDGILSDAQARAAAATVVRNLHYDVHNYFFILDQNGTTIAHGGSAGLEGKNFLNGSDAEKYPLMATTARQILEVSGSDARQGVVTYKMPRSGQEVPLDKIAYTRQFEAWGWSIGTGAYIDDIEVAVNERAMQLFWIFLATVLVAGAVTWHVALDLLRAMRRLSVRITSLTNGELLGDIPEVQRPDEVGSMARALLTLRDTSREVSELKLDHLTGLPTRKLLMDRIRQSKVRSVRSGMVCALMLLDLDKFKSLNDTHGHDAGDRLLKEVAARLSRSVREIDTVARLGGDEFVVLLVDLGADETSARAIASRISQKIIAELNQDYYLGHIVHHCSASIGMTLYKGKNVSADDLLKQADIAMYKSKIADNNVCHFFEDESQPGSAEQSTFEHELSAGITHNQFVLHYQPQVGSNGQLLGCEALLRWQHPVRGLLQPHEFLPLAEKKGLLSPIGNIALELACRQIAAWTTQPELADLHVSVNISTSHFRRAEFVDQLLTIIQRTRIHPTRLTLELSEHVLANNLAIVTEKMTAIRTLGVSFCIDDFGMSYTPLSQLSQLPVRELKICPALVQHVFADTSSLATPKMILALANSLGLDTVAVGVETEAQRSCLMQAGCAGFQGFLYSAPLSADEFVQFVKKLG